MNYSKPMLKEEDVPDFELVKRGDKKAYEKIFHAFYRPMTAYAFRFLNDLEASENIVQDIFLRLWLKRKELLITTSLSHYLFRSVKNHAINYIEHQKIISGYQQMVINTEYERNDYGEFFMEFGLMKKIQSAIDALPEKRQQIFRMAREEGLKYREIADQLGLSVKTVETQMTLALKQLRDALRLYKNLVLFFLFSVRGKL